jgi:hypothetical protein
MAGRRRLDDMRDRKALIAAAVGIAATMVAETVAWADDREQCANAAEQAQTLRDEGKYRRAREQMMICVRDVCPGPIKSDCGKWLDQVERDAPTVVFGAKDGGKDITDVKVWMDGVAVTEKLDGKPQLVDAGEHTFKFEHGGVVKEEKVLIQAGQKGRAISVAFGQTATTTTPPPTPQEEGSLVPALVVGGIGILALGSFTLFGIQGKNEVDDLQKCKPRCAESDVDKARTKLIIADISLGVGIVALAVSAYMIITRPKVSDHVDVKTSRRANDKPTFHFDLGPTPTTGGGAAALGGTF